jgi:hypothetical protein
VLQSFLDPRTCNCIEDKDELDIVQDYLKLFVSKEASSVPRGKGGAQAVRCLDLQLQLKRKPINRPLRKKFNYIRFLW